MYYKCNNLEVENKPISEPGILTPCGNEWDGEQWNKTVDTEYTRNEKCPRCGSSNVSQITK